MVNIVPTHLFSSVLKKWHHLYPQVSVCFTCWFHPFYKNWYDVNSTLQCLVRRFLYVRVQYVCRNSCSHMSQHIIPEMFRKRRWHAIWRCVYTTPLFPSNRYTQLTPNVLSSLPSTAYIEYIHAHQRPSLLHGRYGITLPPACLVATTKGERKKHGEKVMMYANVTLCHLCPCLP